MKHHYHTTPEPAEPTLSQIGRWPLSLRHLHERLAPRFARSEPRRHALLYLHAVISEIPRKNGWQIAEHAKHSRPYGMQRLLSHAVWDHEGVRDELRAFLWQALSPPPLPCERAELPAPFPVLVMDESGFPKRGSHSAGVQPQYCGTTGRVENCQVGVFLSYVTTQGHGLIDRELYLPEDWCEDPARRLAAHIPQSVTFQTKPALAQRMIERAQAAGLPINWVVADTDLRSQPRLARLPPSAQLRLRVGRSFHRSRLCPDPAGLPAQLGRPHRPAGPWPRGLAAPEPEPGHQRRAAF